MLAKVGPGIRLNEHMEDDGETVFRHACKLGLEGIVSKRKDSAFRSKLTYCVGIKRRLCPTSVGHTA
jgi:ATP-dependent DNA ligase